MTISVHESALTALMIPSPARKCAAVFALLNDWRSGRYGIISGADDPLAIDSPGRPKRPALVAPGALMMRRISTREGHAALLHSIAHIEFNAINLALDCVYRFRSFPPDFYGDWLKVASDEALHFGMLQGRLLEVGADYGDYPAHNGLWEMACRTAHDPLARMALVPRVLEARGLDATPPIIAKLRQIGDADSIGVLERILADEVGHVALGDRWFRCLCAERNLDPESTYLSLITSFNAPWPRPPLNENARLAAGFSGTELATLIRGDTKRHRESHRDSHERQFQKS